MLYASPTCPVSLPCEIVKRYLNRSNFLGFFSVFYLGLIHLENINRESLFSAIGLELLFPLTFSLIGVQLYQLNEGGGVTNATL